jgi:hypothetical protein
MAASEGTGPALVSVSISCSFGSHYYKLISWSLLFILASRVGSKQLLRGSVILTIHIACGKILPIELSRITKVPLFDPQNCL